MAYHMHCCHHQAGAHCPPRTGCTLQESAGPRDQPPPPSRVVVITGASSGVGHATAVAFAQTRASVVLAARSAEVLASVADACRTAGGAALAVPTDVSDADDVEQLARAALAQFGRIDVWINNAGVAALGRFEEVPLRDHAQVIQTDLLGTIYGSSVALRQFRAQGGGTVINIASALGEIPAPYYASYVAAKHGIVGLGAAIRQELAENDEPGTHVCTVLPMAMETPFFEHAANYTGHEATPIPPVYDPQGHGGGHPAPGRGAGGRGGRRRRREGGCRVPRRRGGRHREVHGRGSAAGAAGGPAARATHHRQPVHALGGNPGVIGWPVSARYGGVRPAGGANT